METDSDGTLLEQLRKIIEHKDIHVAKERKTKFLQTLSKVFLNPKYTEDVCRSCADIILDIVTRCRDIVESSMTDVLRNQYYQSFCIALSVAAEICPDISQFTAAYLKGTGSLLFTTEKHRDVKFVVSLSKAVWTLVHHLGNHVEHCVSLEGVLNFLQKHQNSQDVVWYCSKVLAEKLNMTSVQWQDLLLSYIKDPVDVRKLQIRHGNLSENKVVIEKNTQTQSRLPFEGMKRLKQTLGVEDLHKEVVMVTGIMLPRLETTGSMTHPSNLIPVPSMLGNLHCLALAASSGNPVLLQGPVGSGKTTLVEHLAMLTGRVSSPHLMKIQLGDQTDSKALLGTYRCTEIPGEFVWKPGVLTRAVREGHWVLLEDVDYAPMDVVSVLLPLLESGMLSLPGHGDNIQGSPGFRLFATQRLLGSSSGWHRQQSGSSMLLEKMWTKINVEPLDRAELEQVIKTKYPQLTTVTDKLLDIYFMVSAGKHDLHDDSPMADGSEGIAGKFLSHDGRLISTRDLMNWCSRIAVDFDVSSTATANLVLQEALDCFVACMRSPEKRLLVAEALGAKLNITKVKSEYYCCKYKPPVTLNNTSLSVGRVTLAKCDDLLAIHRSRSKFSFTLQSSLLLERVAMCVKTGEPVLLVGETGTGKTSTVQFLAEQLGHRLHVINMNQQSDSADLLGGFKPMDMRHVVKPFREEFEVLFCETFSRAENMRFLNHIQECYVKKKWSTLFTLMEHTIDPALKRGGTGKITQDQHVKWQDMRRRVQQLKIQVQQTEDFLTFAFIEGTLVKALRNGDWVLLDEINLAAAETLECLSGLLESHGGSVVLTERGDIKPVIRHENFRLFACMNPATDVGKKDLPIGIRNRFTELYVDELEEARDLAILVSDYLCGLSLTASQIDGIVKFYLTAKEAAEQKLVDGTGRKPHFSLRTLCRALKYAAPNPCGQVARSLYEGFCLSFLTQLDRSSHPVVEKLVCQHIVGKTNVKAMLKQPLLMPSDGKYLNFEGYWISVGTATPYVPDNYIMTPSVRANLRDLARVVSSGQHPVLLQGETSVGKTSLVTWLAHSTGNICVRVNNHEHTDLQEYVGCYAADETRKLVFKEGVLVEAMRKGQWIILDELNLAPTDVLEALNRLLDDNRELFIPETQEVVKAHPKFMLFATQNPPGQYGGRKFLSRAFRNRFVELHFDEIPSGELETILHKRCDIPLSYAKRLVATMLDMQTRRRGSGVFAGKQGFMTLRDLFRWAERYKCKEVTERGTFYDWDQHMADHGYMLLAGRVRKPEEAVVVKDCIQKHLKRIVDPEKLFSLTPHTSSTTKGILEKVIGQSPAGFEHIVWTHGMRRLAVLIGQALQFNEPVLLVGETGCGKTTVCQLYSCMKGTRLHSVNCHLHTESADFLGGLRPCRSHDQETPVEKQKLFEWVDGPLVRAMREGSMFLIDEISLADDSVLERLNSVLEPERRLLLAEKGGGDGEGSDVDHITAAKGFQVFATMNPGGDFGKKELSPALRNRFTEIWCPQTTDRGDYISIIEHNLKPGIHLCNQEDGTSGIGRAIMDFVDWFSNNDIGKKCVVSVRDIICWVNFINTCSQTVDSNGQGPVAMDTDQEDQLLDPAVAFIHGACLVFLDGLGAGTTSRGKEAEIEDMRSVSIKYLLHLVNHMTHQSHDLKSVGLLEKHSSETHKVVKSTDTSLMIWPFSIPKGPLQRTSESKYALEAPTTCVNAQRILRALQLPRPLLLEGSPGVGKTSLVAAIARASGRELVRINLSEQTDVTDLFGADLPVEGEEGGVFAWRDGPLLRALKEGLWIVLDELNLASQSVLEGLNACLDHRAEVYIPELGKTFHIQHEKTRLFACQNPLNQGGGRKGLPRSFLNRFTQVYVEQLTFTDQLFISRTMYPQIPNEILTSMVKFNMEIYKETMTDALWGQRGGPWEFNLRDLFRWCDLLLKNQCIIQPVDRLDPGEHVSLLYTDRFRTIQDKEKVSDLYQRVFRADHPPYTCSRVVSVTQSYLQIGHSFLKREGHLGVQGSKALSVLHHCIAPLESVVTCVEMNWMAILIGPQSCGKTSLVQLLSHLTGNRLHILAMNSSMDTTELLGGFEQSDLGRHLEELKSHVCQMMLELHAFLLLKNDTTLMKKIQSMYESIRVEEKTDEKISSTEEFLRRKKLFTLLKDLFMLCSSVVKDLSIHCLMSQLPDLEKRFTKVENLLQKAKPGSGGGAFEWIDSLLVQALQNGDWLLIDNVNFCNASVLDRLNALLEPDGELSINERGVIDGQIPTIKPHPNFRLFLAMDPRFGEISRAMRNRGVEIYVPGEEEGSPYDAHDIRVMVQTAGIDSMAASDWLISLHNDLRQGLPRGERSSVLDLIQATLITKQHLDRGVSKEEAMRSATFHVYVKNVKTSATRKMTQGIWRNHCEELTSGAETSVTDDVLLNSLSSYKLSSNPSVANLAISGKLFMHLLKKLTIESTNDIQDTMTRNLQDKLKYAWMLILHLTSYSDWTMSCQWIQSVLGDLQRKKKRRSSHALSDFGEQIQYFLQSLAAVQRSGCVDEGTQCLASMGSAESQKLLEEGPVDCRWNLQKLSRAMNRTSEEDRVETSQKLNHLYNRFHLVLMVATELYSHSKLVDKIAKFIGGKDSRMLKLPVIPDLYKLFQNPERVISLHHSTALSTKYHDGNSSVTENITKLTQTCVWWTRLLQATADCIDHSSLDQGRDYKLKLYWDWFYRKMMKPLADSIPPDFGSLINHLHQTLGVENQYSKQFLKFWKSYGHPSPFRTKDEAEMTIRLLELGQCCNIHTEAAEMLTSAKVRLRLAEGNHVIRMLVKCAQTPTGSEETFNKDHVSSLAQSVKMILQKYGLTRTVQQIEVNSTDDSRGMIQSVAKAIVTSTVSEPCQIVELWPLFEYIQLTAAFDFICKTAERDSKSIENTCVGDFTALFTPCSSTELMQYQKVSSFTGEEREKKAEALQELLLNMYNHSWLSTVSHQANRWLSWKPYENHTEEYGPDLDMGPAFAHKAMLSHVHFHYLCGPSTCLSHLGELQPLQVPLGEYRMQGQKLALINTHLWCLASHFTSHNPRVREAVHLTRTFLHCLESLCYLLPLTEQEELCNDLRCIPYHIDNGSVDQAVQVLDKLQRRLDDITNEEIQSVLQRCCELVRDVWTAEMSDRRCYIQRIGSAWVYLGIVHTMLLTPCVPVDPVERVSIKIKHLQQEVQDIDCELEVRNDHHKMMTGSDLTDLSHDLLHPHVQYIMQRKLRLQQKKAELQKQQAYRADLSQFFSLSSDIANYMSSIGCSNNITGLLHKIQQGCGSTSASGAVSEERMWQRSQAAFILNLERNYPYHRDLTVPFCVAVHMVRRGMRFVAMVTEERNEENKLLSESKDANQQVLQDLVVKLARFPIVSLSSRCYVDLVQSLNSESMHNLIKVLSGQSEGDQGMVDSKVVIARLNRCLLDTVLVSSLIRKQLTPDTLSAVTSLLQQSLLSWQQQEEAKRRKEAEDSLYKFKTRVHGDEREHEVIEEAEFKESFPTFEKDFQDVMGPRSLEEEMVVDSETEPVTDDTEESFITDDDIRHVSHVHHLMFTQLVSADWLKPETVSKVTMKDIVRPALHCYSIAAALFRNCMTVLSSDIDPMLIGGHLLTCNDIQGQISPASAESQTEVKDSDFKRSYDIYHDPYLQEVMKCPPVLENLVVKVKELQQEWPDHPTLKQLIEIVERILSFPLTSSVIKFLTGLELLLEKAQDWESNAAKHVSMVKELGDISVVVMEWRKLELNCWNQCLDVIQRKESQKACKWWYFLYQLIQSESDSQVEVDVMTTMKEFMEQSTLGEFEARLNMLKAFHCHMASMEKDSTKAYLVKFLWNLHQFYQQFLQTVKDKIKQLRVPIEKELKGFVKIARWTDMNYWALKQSTEKTHRTLHKHMKAFQAVLSDPVKGILSEEDPGLDSGSTDIGTWKDEYLSALPSVVKKSTDVISQSEETLNLSEADLPLLSKIQTLNQKAVKHWKTLVLRNHRYDKLTVTLDEFTGEVVQTAHELQALQVNQSADKEKQRSEAKHIGLKKRKALADLFKYLTCLGLSYRKGLIINSNQSPDLPLLVQPVDLSALLSQVKATEESSSLSSVWAGCQTYYYKCIARNAKFTSALQTPSKELGVGNIERCKGFITHLNTLMVDQYAGIAEVSQHWKLLEMLLGNIEGLLSSYDQPPQSQLWNWRVKVTELLVSVIEGLHQFEALLQCCPKAVDGESYPSPYLPSSLSKMATVRHGDELWTSCMQAVKEVSASATEMYDKLPPLQDGSLHSWADVSKIAGVLNTLETFLPTFSQMEQLFQHPGGNRPSSFIESITVLKNMIIQTRTDFTEWNERVQQRWEGLVSSKGDRGQQSPHSQDIQTFTQDFGQDVEDLVASLLLVIQALTKSNTDIATVSKATVDQDDETEDLEKDLLVTKLDKRLMEDCKNLHCDKITGKLRGILDKLYAVWEGDSPIYPASESCCQLLLHCLPLLRQYGHIVQYYTLQLLACHRTCSKMLSVLLAMFTELATKGFCLPAELEDEAAGEGATEFEDIEGGGMGEGEGVKDVSDQIENEDQLDEAQKPGEKKEEDASNQPDVRSEVNAIEMNEDFEGKVQDLEAADMEEDNEEDKEEEGNELDRQMGEVDEKDADKLDEKMWGEEEEEEKQEENNDKEEFGPGSEQEQSSDLVANEDNKDRTETKDGQKKEQQGEEEEKDRMNEKEMFDETEINDDKVDPTTHEKPDQPPDAMELPDDLHLDEEEADKEEEGQGQDEDSTKEEENVPESEDNNEDREPAVDSVEIPELKEEEGVGDPEKEETEGENNEKDKDMSERQEETEEMEDSGIVAEEEEGGKDNSQEGEKEAEEAQPARHAGKTTHDSQNVEQSDMSQDQAGEGDNDQDESEGVGMSQTERSEGHEGQTSSKVTTGTSEQRKKPLKRKPGKSDAERSLGSTDQKYKKLKTTDLSTIDEQEEEKEESEGMETDLYEHIKDPSSHHDAQTIDTATNDQQAEQPIPNKDMEEEPTDDGKEIDMDQDEVKDEEQRLESLPTELKKTDKRAKEGSNLENVDDTQQEDNLKHEVDGDIIETMSAARKPESTIHTTLENLYIDSKSEVNIEKLRAELEEQLTSLSHADNMSTEGESSAAEAWHKYEALTSTLSQELCEQLRLVLEPSQATKLKGDYRTGKRLNMRKVIPYIASQFRKDKIWLRRTKPSKRQYQILLAIDDSSSMVDNHSKQLAYESLALLANGLMLLEVGELAICSFGETVKLLHPFTEQFTSQSGARILQHFTFEQKKTKIAQLLKQATAVMMDARSRQHGMMGNPDTSQLLLIVSDGRGLFVEGMETVKSAVQKAREANIFIVFVIIDSPHSKDSILDIKVPVFKSATQIPEIKSYMDHFPFPFYIILRDINSLPEVMSDALRQWFELVTDGDR